MRVALFGSPDFALPSLESLHRNHELLLVVSQPDKPAGRGKRLQSPATAQRAKDLGIRLEQPKRLKNQQDFFDLISDLKLDVAITAAYGKILPQALLDIPKHGFLNVHASLLPKYRGAAPIQWALIEGEQETGISIMQTEAGLDTGPVRFVKKMEISEKDTALSLFASLSTLGAMALEEALEKLESGTLPLQPQDDSKATIAPLLSKEDGKIRWTDDLEAIWNRYRGVYAWPGSWTLYRGAQLKIHQIKKSNETGKPGRILQISQTGITVGSGTASLLLELVQPPNKARMTAYDWANGYGVKVGDELG